ncbi:pilin [Francisella salimarina]|uniref:pilin n=1 Tax=Francisella salimarina TaxID=2599927 RepID=UPI003D815B39
MKKKIQKGFSLVELMVVIAIIAILAAVAIPMYSNYTTRAKIGGALTAVGGVKSEIAEALANNSTPTDGTNVNMPTGTSLTNATASGATIIMYLSTMPATANDNFSNTDTIALTATAANNQISWTCAAGSGSTLTASQLPSPCNS